MEEKKYGIPWRRLLVFAAIGIIIGITVFLIADSAVTGSATMLCAVIAFLTGLLFFSISAGAIFYSLYKRNNGLWEENKDKASGEKPNKIYDRSFLDPFLEGEIDAAARENQPLSIIMADLDHFREINDTYGNIVGDHILTIFAQVILKSVRQTDIIARYGGDELLVIMPGTDTDTARAIAEKMREDVANTYIPPIDNVVVSSINCSVGVSTYPGLCDGKVSLIRTSDLALYMAKRSGRNCTRVYQKGIAVG